MGYTGLKQIIIVVIFTTMLMMMPILTDAVEVLYPVPAYTPEELAKVREWEKIWVGKKIDQANIDQVADFFPSSCVELFKNPEKWNAPPEGNFFTIVPYRQIIETSGMIEATQKYSPMVKTDAEGIILNYKEIAGIPFPNPKTGLEIAYNFECNTRGDSSKHRYYAPNANPRTKTDRIADQKFQYLYYIHRVDMDPRPAFPDNPKSYHRGEFMHMYLPPEMLNTRFFTMRHVDPKKQDLSYIYYAQYRRIRRMSTSERTNAIDGTDMIYDDGQMWDGHLTRNTYTLKGKKEMLLCRHQDMTKVTRQTGQGFANGYEYERCNTYVLEVINNDPNYLYNKRIWYVDPETYIIMWQEVYDQLGRFWKCFCHHTNNIQTAKGEMKNYYVGFTIEDFQRTHSGFTKIHEQEISIDINPNIYTLSNLQKTY
jgi:hypothetical protein